MWLINGWTEGKGYHHSHGSTICDNGHRISDIGEILMEKVEIDIDGKLISLEAGDLARQAGGAIIHFSSKRLR